MAKIRLTVAMVVTALLCGCASEPPPPQTIDRGPMVSQGGDPSGRGAGWVPITIQGGVVRAEVERQHEVDQLISAAEAAMRSRGFVLEKVERLEEPLTITGKMGGTPDSRHGLVSLLIGPTKVRIETTVRPNGNDAESRAVLKRMLELLGYGA